MANIKFSQFTVGNTESDIDFVVGYKGANNIQISPANLLSATLTGYLPLTGGAMAGNLIMGGNQIKFSDAGRFYMGDSNDLALEHNGSFSQITNATGDFYIQNTANDKDIIFRADDGSGGLATYFYLDGSLTTVTPRTVFPDDSVLGFGTGADLQIYHDGTTSNIANYTNNLSIINHFNDGDIKFFSDDGSGGVTEYFRLDGGSEITIASKAFRFNDGVATQFGTGLDMQIYHSGGEGTIQNYVGNLRFIQSLNDGDIQFFSDDGSGGTTEYFRVDGGTERIESSKSFRFADSARVQFGASSDMQIYHDGSNSYISNDTGALYIQQLADNSDIVFQSDNGSGGIIEYLRLDGSDERLTVNAPNGMLFFDNIKAKFGTSSDLLIYHDGTNSRIYNETGDLYIRNNADDKDIYFQSDNGSGGVATYLQLDGSATNMKVSKDMRFLTNVDAEFGTGGDFKIYHDGSNQYLDMINSGTGDIVIQNQNDDRDIVFKSDDGSGGVTTYMMLDGSQKYVNLKDSITLTLGTGNDLRLLHNGSDSRIENYTGNLTIQQRADDSDIVFQCDDGSGGLADYFRLDGSDGNVKVYKQFGFLDNVKATFGNSGDLEVYHSGSHSFINGSNGAGSLYLRPGAGGTIQLETPSGVDMISTNATDVRMYSSGNERLRVKNIGINIQNVPTYADNTAAIAGGLTTGDVYRTGDLLKIVH